MVAVSHEVPPVEGADVIQDVVRETVPALAVVLAIVGVREGEVLDEVRHVGHARVQVLVARPSHELEVAGHSGHLDPTLRVAAALAGLVVPHPAVGLHLDRALEPAEDLGLASLVVEEVERAIRLVEPEHRIRVDALRAAEILEVDAVYPDEAHGAVDAVLVLEEHGRLRAGTVHLPRDPVPDGRELLAVAAPAGEEVDEREVVCLEDMLEALVLEAVVRARPVRVELLLPVLLLEPLHLLLVVLRGLVLALRRLVRLYGHAVGAALLVHGPQPEVLGEGVDLNAALGEDGDPKVAALDVEHVHVEVDLQRVGILCVERQRGGVGGVGERADLEHEGQRHDAVREDREDAPGLGGLHEVAGQVLRSG
mmetsp:Transcript_70285/g.206164  ORF Transcript_70285/g.206164 Transcript_70285/m.206164 type:complete len:367 (+) Transcript_70285:328-1428(+)